MATLPYEELPVVLVSVADATNGAAFIRELVDNEVTNIEVPDTSKRDPVWQLTNKYYTAEVRVHEVVDGAQPICDMDCIEAHIIYLSGCEVRNKITDHLKLQIKLPKMFMGGQGEVQAQQRWQSARAWGSAQVRVVAGAWADAPPNLHSWAVKRRYEIVPLAEVAPTTTTEDPMPFADEWGVHRARAALHTHPWRGLRQHRAPKTAIPDALDLESASGSSSGCESDEEGAVERAEAFALALGALRAARPSPADDAERRRRAEELLDALSCALGHGLRR